MNEQISRVIESLEQIESDNTVPRNIISKVKTAIEILQQDQEIPIMINKSLQELDELSSDSNIPRHIRAQIWGIVSLLETI